VETGLLVVGKLRYGLEVGTKAIACYLYV
jgi:hypothetical protein